MSALPKISTIHFRRRIALASAAAAFLVGVLVTADVVLPDRPGATAEAAEVLNNAAAATIQASDPVVGPGQYMKVETTTVNGASAVAADGSRVSWLLLDQTVLVVLNEVDILRQVSDTCRALITALSPGQRSARRRFAPTEYRVTLVPYRDRVAFMVRVRFTGVKPANKWLDVEFWLTRRVESPRFRRIETLSPCTRCA